MVTLTESDILSRTEAATLDDVRSLNLWGLGLTDVSLLAKLPNLEVLSLSVNRCVCAVGAAGTASLCWDCLQVVWPGCS